MNKTIVLDNVEYDLTSPKELLELVTRFTDGVYNESDMASFTTADIKAIQEIREYYNSL